MSHTLPHKVISNPRDVAGNMQLVALNLAACIADAKQVDIADNYMASDRLTPNLREIQEQLDTVRNDLRSKRGVMRIRNERLGSVDANGDGVDHPINM